MRNHQIAFDMAFVNALCLFLSSGDSGAAIYNEGQPHSSLGYLTPLGFKAIADTTSKRKRSAAMDVAPR